MKKLLVLALLIALLCPSFAVATTPAADTAPPAGDTDELAEAEGTGVVGPDGELLFSGPYIVTTCGQSPGAVMVSMTAKQAGLESSYINGMTVEDLNPEVNKTLVVTAGTSMKGMGAAGTDVELEIKRCLAIIAAAKEAGMVVIGAHVEGMARRTDSADEASIEAIMAEADIILVVDESDSDGFFTKYAEEHEVPLLKVKDALSIGSVLQ